jgi:hypothetical protein
MGQKAWTPLTGAFKYSVVELDHIRERDPSAREGQGEI